MAFLKPEFESMLACSIKGSSECSPPPPSQAEIADFADKLKLPVNLVKNIFNNIGAKGMVGGAAAEPSPDSVSSYSTSPSTSVSSISSSEDEDDESTYVSKSGYSQSEQNNYVNNIMLAGAALATVGTIGVTVMALDPIEQYLYNKGILDPLCKGPLDRAVRIGLNKIDEGLGGPDCDARLERAKTFVNRIMTGIPTAYGTLTAANWNRVHAMLKEKLFGSMAEQKRITRKNRKKRKKQRAKALERKTKKAEKKKKKAKAKAKAKKDKAKSIKRSPSRSASKSRSPSQSRSARKTRSQNRSNA